MRIAVLSDIHDNTQNLERALNRLEGVEVLLCCGDLCAPFSLKQIQDSFPGPIHVVLGNNDGDPLFLAQTASQREGVHLYQPLVELELGGRKIAVTHYPQIGRALAASGQYDAVFSGHTHYSKVQQVGDTLWANPGEVLGHFEEPGFGIYDTETGGFELIRL
ncbi:MAG: metallophosphoesterase [Chloroflexota bacterium]|nr:metallophosphoesterase [Chloroflexota bacterium]